MTLKETLAGIPKDEYIFIGTKNGSSWLDICTREELEKSLDELSNSYLKQKQKSLASANDYLDNMGKRIEDQNKVIDRLLKELSDACARLAYITGDFEPTRKKKEYLDKYLSNWKDMADRDVVQTYPNNDNAPGGVAILITGDEAGKYWTLDEVEKDKKARAKKDGNKGSDKR